MSYKPDHEYWGSHDISFYLANQRKLDAQYKSKKALRNELALFDQIIEMNIYKTDTITTHLVLQLKTSPLKV